MAKLSTNWDSVRQDMTDDAASMIKETRDSAIEDIEQRLFKKGLDSQKTTSTEDTVTFITDDKQEFEEGKVYFDEVYEEISDDDWLETL